MWAQICQDKKRIHMFTRQTPKLKCCYLPILYSLTVTSPESTNRWLCHFHSLSWSVFPSITRGESHLYIYIKRLGMFPFKVQLFQGCRSETEPINTKSVVQHVIRYQVLLAPYYKAVTKYCCCRTTYLSGHIVDSTTHTSTVCMRY
jgi:hypothetical protein